MKMKITLMNLRMTLAFPLRSQKNKMRPVSSTATAGLMIWRYHVLTTESNHTTCNMGYIQMGAESARKCHPSSCNFWLLWKGGRALLFYRI